MAGGKETPRQKMIGLMYLVLMALLAMNVSKEVINAFVTLNDKIDRGNAIIKNTMEGAYNSFDGAIAGLKASGGSKEDIENIEKIQKQALQVKEWSKSLTNYFVLESDRLIKESGDASYGIEHEGGSAGSQHYHTDEEGYHHLFPLMHLSKKDDYDVATRLYIGDGGHKSPSGMFIVDSITNYRDKLCTLIATYKDDKGKEWSFTPPEGIKIEKEGDPAAMQAFKDELNTALATVNPKDTALIVQLYGILTPPEMTENHGEEYPWIAKQFDHAPLVAAIAMFTSIRSDILQAENKAVNHIASRVAAPKFNFNKIEPLAFSSTSYINQGDSLGLSIMIAAYDSTEKMKLTYWVDDTLKTAENQKTFEGKAGEKLTLSGGVGGHTVVGTIAVKEKGVEKYKPWKFNYSVGAPNAAVAAADLNVLYRQWDNKIKVSASGYDPSTVSVSCSGCSISKSGDFFIAKVSGSSKTAKINVSAKTDDGKSVSLASEEFRVFPLPTPKPYFAGQTFDKPTMKKGTAMSATKLTAKLGDSPLNVPYSVTSYKMIVSKNGKIMELKSNGAKLTGEMKNAIKKTPKGGSVTFINITAKGPGGKSKPIGGLSFKML